VNAATGIATALSAGSAAITAIAKNPDGTVVTGTAVYTVTIPTVAEPLVSMAIVPASQTLTLLGQTAQLTAIATTGTGTTVNLTNQTASINGATIQPAVWNSGAPGVATVNPGTGLVTAITAGTTVITAIASNPDGTVVTGVSTVTVTATGGAGGSIASIAVIPATQSVPSPNATAQFIAIGTTTTGATVNLTNQVAWSSSSAQIGTVGAATGLATGVAQGSATMTALYTPPGSGNVVTGIATLTVVGGTSEPINALSISPVIQSLSATGQKGQFIALGTSGITGLQQDVTNSAQIKWASSIPTIATVTTGLPTGNGVAAGVSAGQTTITAEWTNPDGSVVSAAGGVTVTASAAPEPLLSLSIVPAAVTVGNILDTGQFLALGTFSTAPTIQDLTNQVTWISSSQQIFPINTTGVPGAPAGVVTALGYGTDVVIAQTKNPDGTIVTGTATFSCPLDINTNQCTPSSAVSEQIASLTVYDFGVNQTTWLVTAPSATNVPNVIHCGPASTSGGSVCVGTYPIGTTVLLTATQTSGSFGGWSSNCTPVLPVTANGPNSCQVTVTYNDTVGAIFN
jgi:hypothetical protein